MLADTVSFSLQSYQISHTTVSVRSIGDEGVDDDDLSFSFLLFSW